MALTGTTLMRHSERQSILLLGKHHIPETEFTQRRLTLRPIEENDLGNASITNQARGVVLSFPPGKLRLIEKYFEELFEEICGIGLMTCIYLADEDEDQKKKSRAYISAMAKNAYLIGFKKRNHKGIPTDEEIQSELSKWAYHSDSLPAIAETLAHHKPGPPMGTTRILPDSIRKDLDTNTEALLKRAFHDAESITVHRLKGGRTAKETFCIHANIAEAEFGPQPMPFFVKFGTIESCEKEKQNYKDIVEPFIPFQLHPSLNSSRSVNTLFSGALVCNFVESATSLRSALQTDQAHGVIFSLFEVTLRGLRMHTLKSSKMPGIIEAFLDERVRAVEIEARQPERIKLLQKSGRLKKPQEIEATLKRMAAGIETRRGHYHGDLHYGNIMARHRDAIVIDFGSMGEFGPLFSDPAILEISLVFGTDNHDDPNSFEAWCKFVDYVYEHPLSPPLPHKEHHQFTWLHRALRELRHVIACSGVEEKEALIILSGCMLRYGKYPPFELESEELNELAEKRRTYALTVAYQLCDRLEEKYGQS